MARDLNGKKGGNFPPALKFNTAGERFVGKLTGVRDSNYGKSFVFAVVDGTAFIGRPDGTKNEKGHNNYASVDVAPGDSVELGTSKGGQLESKLLEAIVGETIEINFIGWKSNPKTGRSFKDFSAKVI